MDDLNETQLDDEEAEAYLIRMAAKREAEKERLAREREKQRSFRWSGGMG